MDDSLTLWLIFRLLDAQHIESDPSHLRDISDNEKILQALANLLESKEAALNEVDRVERLAAEYAQKLHDLEKPKP